MKKCFFIAVFLMTYPVKAQTNENKPVQSFEKFWNFFNNNYASFKEKNIDWKARYEKYHVQINPQTADTTLFRYMKTMLSDFRDDHVNLRAPSIDSFFNAGRNSEIIDRLGPIPAKNRRVKFNEMTEHTLIENGFDSLKYIGPEYKGRELFAYAKSKTMGYLRYTRSFSSHKSFNFELTSSLLNKIFKEFEDLDAVILDVRFNMGGDTSFTNNVIGRFLEERILGNYKQNRKNGSFGKLRANYFGPRGRYRFTNKPVVVLLNDQTVSAADELTMVMSALDNVTLIGESSNGSYSNMKPKKLPNGWVVTLSYQRYLDSQKNNFEGYGTPVDIEVKNTLQDVKDKHDSVLIEAFQHISRK